MKDISKRSYGFLMVNVANAATLPTGVLDSSSKVVSLFCTVMVWMFWALMTLSIMMFLVGGFMYVTSGGEAEKAGKANKTLLYAAIGVAVAICAKGVPLLVGSFLGVDTSSLNAC